MRSFLFIFSLALTSLFGTQIVFIVNPLSHELKDLDLREVIDENLDLNQFEYEILSTQQAEHATLLARNAVLKGADIVAAVGGDGTVNEVGRALVHTEAVLAIIPAGSGNGLARHLGIPMNLARAIRTLNHAHPIAIDTAQMNGKTFLGVAGIGFDAHIAEQFARFGKRGPFSYFQVALREFSNYEPQSYLIDIDGKKIIRKAFILTFANGSQYGNDFVIAPKASLSDGDLDLVIIDPIPAYSIPRFLYRFKHGTLDHSRHFKTQKFKEITIHHPSIQAHIDGEPVRFEDSIRVTVQPNSLKVLIPKI